MTKGAQVMPPSLLTLHEVAERLSVSYWTARHLTVTGLLPCVRLPAAPRRRTFRKGRLAGRTQIIKAGGVRVTPDDLQAFIAKHRRAG